MANLPERQIPFKFSKCGLPNAPGLDPEAFALELSQIPRAERMAMVRTWVQDRSPAAFSTSPYLWEAVREWIAKRYSLSPRQIGLSGSAQIGFSTHPWKAFAPFNKNGSDLDLYIVSDSLFATLEREANLFVSRQMSAGKSDFVEQADTTSRALARGYVDIRHVPARDLYPTCARLKNDASIIIDKLKLAGFNLKPSHFRIYRDWSAKAAWTNIQVNSWASSPQPISTHSDIPM